MRAVWLLHRGLGLGIGVLILFLSATGGLLVMHPELERLAHPERHVVTPPPAGSRVPLAPLVQELAALAPPDHRLLRLEPAAAADRSDKILFLAPDGRTRWAVFTNPYTGEVLWHGPDQALLTPWLLHLHMHLRLGGWGYLITAAAGIALFLLGLSGLILHRRRLRELWRWPRLHRGWRVACRELHGWIGVIAIYFPVVLGLTGAIYALKVAPGQIAAPKPLTAPFSPAKLAPIEPALAFARDRFPGGEITRIAFATQQQSPLVVTVLHRAAPVWRKFSRIEFDPATGRVRAVRDAREASAFDQFAAMLSPLHFGFYGSPLVKWLYVLGGFTPALLALSGAAIWLLRWRRARARRTRFLTGGLAAARVG